MKYKYAFVWLILIGLISCKFNVNKSSKDILNLQSDLDQQVNTDMPGILVSVISKDKNINWSGASGYADIKTKSKLLPNQTFRIASVTKTFVAASILRLWEDGKLKLEDTIEKYISTEHADLLKQDDYNLKEITIYHLLTHSGGLSEHTQSEKYQMEYLQTNPVWTRTQQLKDLVRYADPVGKLGEQFSYSDSGYILLGEIIETITKKSLGDAIFEQLKLKELGLSSIHMESPKGEFSEKRIHQYYKGEDTYNINPTFDLFGGGGLLSTTQDLSLFYQYLFQNKIFKEIATLDKMISPVLYSSNQSLDYRMGIWKTKVNGMAAYTHSGFWGTQVVYIPKIKASIAVNYSQKWKDNGLPPIIPIVVEKLMEK